MANAVVTEPSIPAGAYDYDYLTVWYVIGVIKLTGGLFDYTLDLLEKSITASWFKSVHIPHFVVCNQLRDRRISLHVALTLRLPKVECLISTTYLESIGMRRLTNADFLLCWQGLKMRFTICSQIHKILSISSSRPNFESLTHLPTVHGPSKTISAATCIYLDQPASKFKLF